MTSHAPFRPAPIDLRRTARRWAPAVAILAITASAGAQNISSRVRSILNDPRLGQARTGVVIMNATTGEILANVRGDEQFIPASNQKLITSGAALAVLGSDFQFRTELLFDAAHRATADGPGAPAVTGGRVVIRGSGDPALGDPKLLEKSRTSVEWVLETWIGALRAANVPAGTEIVVDDRVFDRQFVHPSWPVEQLNRWYCAEVCGTNFHTNLLSIFADPREAGRPPRIKVEPSAPWIEVRNRARGVRQGNHTVWASRDADGGMTLFGDVRFANDPVEISLVDVPTFVGKLLADRMTGAGMKPARVRLASADEDLTRGAVVHVFTTNIDTALQRCNVDSYNLYAEALIKRLGNEVTRAPGSWTNGSAVIRMVLQEKLGIDAGRSFTIADGSGMSRNNRVTPKMLAEWLDAMISEERTRDPFLESLPRAGVEGTLRKRFRGGALATDVRAKTGYLSGVSAISGYAISETSGRKAIFVIITNDKPNRVQLSAIRDAEERIIRIADEWAAGKPSQGAAGSR